MHAQANALAAPQRCLSAATSSKQDRSVAQQARRQPVALLGGRACRHSKHGESSVQFAPPCSPTARLSVERLPERASSPCSVSGLSSHSILCASGVSHPSEEREALGSLHIPTTGMAKGLGSRGGGATLQRSKLNTSQEVRTWQPNTDDSGGGGIGGKNIFNGGGGGDGSDDDDDYMDDFGDGDGEGGDEGFFRAVVGQLYDRASINAVMQEWFRTVGDMPLIIRQAVEMGLFSSAQLVRFMQMDYRPTVTRALSRKVPSSISRGLVGRMMADPAFVQKLLMEQLFTIGSSLYWEKQQRGDRFSKELDFVAINTLCLAAANASLVWMVSPNRSFGAPHKFPFQSYLHGLPNNVFDMSGPQRSYTTSTRAVGFFAKVGELSAVGTLAGASMAGLSQLALRLRQKYEPGFQPSVRIPSVRQSAGGLAVSMGIFSNLRYQLISGVDRYLFDHSNYLWSYLVSSGIVRLSSNRLGEPTRLALQGLPMEAPQRPRLVPAAAGQRSAGSITVLDARAPAKRRPASKGKKLKKKLPKGFEMSAAVPSA